MAELDALRDRFRGLMVGTAVGDCLGRPVEGHRTVGKGYIEEILGSPPSLIYTDDTAMTMVVAESLLASDGFEGSDMALRFAEEYSNQPHRGYGRSVVQVFMKVSRGVPWAEAARSQFGGQGSYGNGAAMRVAPVALWAFPEVEDAAVLAGETAKTTHTHPAGVEGAVIQAVAAVHALREDVLQASLLRELESRVETDEFRPRLKSLRDCLEARDDDRARLHLGNCVSAQTSVLTALYCFLVSDDFEQAIVKAVCMGGDTDTIAAMAGALAGARFGLGGIPDIWAQVEAKDHLVDLADRMVQRVHEGR